MSRKYDLYGVDASRKEKSVVEYEVAKLPLQDYVSPVRKAACNSWNQFQVNGRHNNNYC